VHDPGVAQVETLELLYGRCAESFFSVSADDEGRLVFAAEQSLLSTN
jgi:hypothetical protein